MSAAKAAAPPGSATTLRASQRASWARWIASSGTRTTWSTCRLAMGYTSVPTRRGARESAAMPPAGASTGPPAWSAIVSVGEASGSTPTTLTLPRNRDTGDKPTTSDRDKERVEIGALLLHLQPDCPLAQECFTLVEGVD